MTHLSQNDLRQRFFFEHSPVRGDIVRLQDSYQTISQQKTYPKAIKYLLGEMLTATSLLIGTLKINGRLSLQLQSSDTNSLLNWAMAECDNQGNIRALANWQAETQDQQNRWQQKNTANDAFAELGQGVLFINIQPEQGEAYQGIVERVADNLADCLAHYQRQSAQIPTIIKLASDDQQTGGILLQLLPKQASDTDTDTDLFPRLSMLTNTLKSEELTRLPANEILYRLYHEENIITPEPTPLTFACTCSQEKCESTILQLGKQEAIHIAQQQNQTLDIDCGFCGTTYQFNTNDIEKLFNQA